MKPCGYNNYKNKSIRSFGSLIRSTKSANSYVTFKCSTSVFHGFSPTPNILFISHYFTQYNIKVEEDSLMEISNISPVSSGFAIPFVYPLNQKELNWTHFHSTLILRTVYILHSGLISLSTYVLSFSTVLTANAVRWT